MKPILFNTDMIRAIQADRKMVTRRVVKPQPREIYHGGTLWEDGGDLIALVESRNGKLEQVVSPYRPGDILYVRETWNTDPDDRYVYRADCHDRYAAAVNWKPSIHMPREAARIFLRVTDVRVERLQEINTYGTYAEGIHNCNIDPLCVGTCDKCMQPESPLHKFERLWDSTIKPASRAFYGWEANPWVWVIAFERISREEAENGLQRVG